MTIKNRKRKCLTCKKDFFEKKSDSNDQWENRKYCSAKCNNASEERKTDIFTRLEKFQIKKDSCWGWSGSKDGKGYGILSSRNGRGFSPEKAHRVSYEKENGKIPEGLNICHKCDNPECTNPDHLFAGTQKQNMMDCSAKNRISQKSKDNLKHEKALSDDDIKIIKDIKFVGKNGRGDGETVKSVANRFNVCEDTIRKVKYGKY